MKVEIVNFHWQKKLSKGNMKFAILYPLDLNFFANERSLKSN